jgi:O-antigen/teichoic acid export membrane protein
MSVGLRSVGLVYFERYFGVLATLGTSMLVARILTPEEIGLQSVAIALVSLMQLFRDMGLSTYIHTVDELTQERFSACLGISVLTGALLFIAVLVISQFAEPLFNDGRVGGILMILSIGFLLYPFQTIIFAVFVRQMRFGRILAYSVSLQAFSVVCTVTFALTGFSYFTSALSGALTGLAGLFLSIALRERSLKLHPSLAHGKSIIRITVWPFISGLVKFASERTPELIIGRSMGYASSAYFEKAWSGADYARRLSLDGLYSLFVGRLNGTDATADECKLHAGTYLACAVVIGLPMALLVHLASPSIIQVMFGSQWDRSIPLLSLIAFVVPLVFYNAAANQVMYGRGDYKTGSLMAVTARTITILTIALTFNGSLEGVCTTILAVEAVLASALSLAAKDMVDWRTFRALALRSLPSAGVSYLGVVLFAPLSIRPDGIHALAHLIQTGVVFSAIWAITMTLMRHPFTLAVVRSPTLAIVGKRIQGR